jgi:hypothetical protein
MPGAGGVRPLVLFSLLAFLLSGCLKLDATLTVGPDNTITGDYIVAYKKDPNRPDSGLGTVRELLVTSGTATATRYDDGDYEGTRYRLESVPLADLARFVPVTYDRRQTGTVKITRDGDDFLVAGTFDFREAKPTKRTPEQQRQAEDLFKVRVQLTFPGPVETGNGTIEGNTITWQMNPFVLTTLQAQASATPPPVAAPPQSASHGMVILAVGGAAVALLILLGLGLWALRRRRRAGPAPDPIPEAVDPSDFAWVMGDRRPPPQPGEAHGSWTAPPPDLRYGPGLGGPAQEPQHGPGLGTPVGQVSWYGPPAGPPPAGPPPAGPPHGGPSYAGPPSGPVPVGPPSGPVPVGPPGAPRADYPAANGYGPPPAQFRPQQGHPPHPPGSPPPEPPWNTGQWPPEPPPGPPQGSG